MQKIVFLFLLVLITASGSNTILFAQFQTQADAQQTQQIIQKILKKKHPKRRVYIQKKSGQYRVVSDPIPDEDERNTIVQDVQRAFGVEGEEGASSHHHFTGIVQSSLGYNNNIYDHTRIKKTTYNAFTIDNNTSIVRDLYLTNAAQLSHSYATEGSPVTWNTSVSLFDKRYRHHSDINLRQIGFESGFGYALDDRYFALPLAFKRLWYGGAAYRHIFSLSPKIIYKPDQDTSLSAQLILSGKRYIPTSKKDWNSNHAEINLGFDLLTHSQATILGKFGLLTERRTQGSRWDVSYNGLYVSGRFLMPLWKGAYADLGFRFDKRAYRHKHPNLALRRDTRFKLDTGLIQPITESISAKINYAHIENISTINAYTHKSDTITVSLSASF